MRSKINLWQRKVLLAFCLFSCFSSRGQHLPSFFFNPVNKQVFFICAFVLIDREQDDYVAHMWEMFRQGSGYSVYSPI